MKNCKACKFWKREMAMDKAGRVRSDRPADCLYVIPQLPASYFVAWQVNLVRELRSMAAFDGKQCQTFRSRDER